LSVNFLIGDAELSEVKQEVRQTTLLDAQKTRITTLLDTPLFTENWEQLLNSEFEALQQLEDAGSDEEEIATRIRDLYAAHLVQMEDIDAAIVVLDRGRTYGEFPEVERMLEEKALARVRILLDGARPQESWLKDLNAELIRLHDRFPDSGDLAELDLEIGNTLEVLVHDALESNQLDEAAILLGALEPRFFDVRVLDELERWVVEARSREATMRQAREVALVKREQAAELDEALTGSCLRIDLARIETLALDQLRDEAVNQKVSTRLSDCLIQLSELDPDRAATLQREVQARFGEVLVMQEIAVDPCGLNYLIGNGSQLGRRGSCADRISDETQGPRLVVVPAEETGGRFAITKEEVSWSQFRKFCVEQEGCTMAELEVLEVDDRMPVTGVSLDTVKAYARWLSEVTGYLYRLPTATEWLQASRGEPDPNRNCRVQLDGVQRGVSPIAAGSGQSNEFGLLNTLGNVQEWAIDGERVVAIGGSFSDPIGICVVTTVRSHEGEPAVDTGFRLVREVS